MWLKEKTERNREQSKEKGKKEKFRKKESKSDKLPQKYSLLRAS